MLMTHCSRLGASSSHRRCLLPYFLTGSWGSVYEYGPENPSGRSIVCLYLRSARQRPPWLLCLKTHGRQSIRTVSAMVQKWGRTPHEADHWSSEPWARWGA